MRTNMTCPPYDWLIHLCLAVGRLSAAAITALEAGELAPDLTLGRRTAKPIRPNPKGLAWGEQTVPMQAEARCIRSEVHQRHPGGVLTPRCFASHIPGIMLEATLDPCRPTMPDTRVYQSDAGALASDAPGLYGPGDLSAHIGLEGLACR
jgi:hypothetical protein